MDYKTLAANVQLVVFDVDGVLTNGQLFFGSNGEELKVFHSQDGLAISAARRAGLKTAIITGRWTTMVELRSAELRIDAVYQGVVDKLAALHELLKKYALTPEQVAYVGDDLNDLAAMSVVGLPCAVGNAVPEVKKAAGYIAERSGGNGAAREIIEMILKAQGKWAGVVASYLQPGGVEAKQ
ncbi:MAG: kdsC [Firmicutes bacterium]|nr:kdsC [Bacillota bacterium]